MGRALSASARTVLLLALGAVGAVVAGEAPRLDEASVVVADRGPEARDEAIARGLAEVLVRMTGLRGAPESAPALLAAPQRYLLQYSYALREAPDPVDPERISEQLFLDMRFDGESLGRSFSDHGLPLWGSERPTTLLWMVVDGEEGRSVLAEGTDEVALRAIADATRARGLPVLLPLMDLEDQRAVNESDLWAMFEEPVIAASARYSADEVVMGRVERVAAGDEEGFEVRWMLMQDQAPIAWATYAPSADAAIREGLEQLADAYATRFAVQAGQGATGIEVVVHGVAAFADYARALAYLQSLTPVDEVQVSLLAGATLTLEVQARGGRDALQDAISLGTVLQPLGEAEDGSRRDGDPRSEEDGGDRDPVRALAGQRLEYELR